VSPPATVAGTSTGAAPPGKLTLIGAGHVFRIQETIRGAIQALQPDIVFVELDLGRLQALVERSQGKEPPVGGTFVHRRLAAFQAGVAGLYGAEPGSEMLAAVRGARDVGARLSLIDDPAEQTIRRALKQITWRERLRAVGMLAGSAVRSLWPASRRKAKSDIEEELQRYQKDPDAMLAEVRRKFPTLHRVLIAERDAKMAQRIRNQLAGVRHGVAILGDGHVGGMERLLADLKPDVYRLEAVRAGTLPRPGPVATGTTESVGFTVRWGVGTPTPRRPRPPPGAKRPGP
jgi:pheromone shutdown protein TraB